MTKANVSRPLPYWLLLANPFRRGGYALIPNRLPEENEACGCMLSSICDSGMYPGRRILGHPKNVWTEQSVTGSQWIPRPSESSAVMWVRALGQRLGLGSFKSNLHCGLGNRIVSSLQRNHGSQWIVVDVGRRMEELPYMVKFEHCYFCFPSSRSLFSFL